MFSRSSTSREFGLPSFDREFSQLYKFSENGFIENGAHGSVYSGVRLADQTPVAIKVVQNRNVPPWEMSADRQFIPREVVFLKKVANVEGVIKLLDWFCIGTGPEYVIVMERPENAENLQAFYNRNPKSFNETLAQSLFSQLVRAVHGCHQVGVLHGDIKEENILINRESKLLKLIDFSLSDYLIPRKIYKNFIGTATCAPPEWFISQQYNGVQAEIWTIGLLFYRLITGNDHPFKNNFNKSLNDKIDLGNAQLPLQFKNLICQCLAPNPHNRISLENILCHPCIHSSSKGSTAESNKTLQN